MKRVIKICTVTLMVLILIAVCFTTVSAVETEAVEEWIEIYTVEDLYNVRNDLSANYILMNDIDLTEATAEGGDYDYQGCGWNPIGSANGDSGTFRGVFDGNGYSIIGMRIVVNDTMSYYGLFSYILGGTVKNLGMDGGNIAGQVSSGDVYVGFIAGYCYNGVIENCYNTGNVLGRISSTNNSRLTYVGGIVGRLKVDYKNGKNKNIHLCYNTGDIAITEAYGKVHAGGICGDSEGRKDSTTYYSRIQDSYNTGNIDAVGKTGSRIYACGISGQYIYSSILGCYNVGAVKYGISYNTTTNVSEETNYVTSSYYNGSTYTGAQKGVSLNQSQISNKAMYTGFDFENDWIIDTNANYPYPQLRSNPQDLSKAIESVNLGSLPAKTEYLTGDVLDVSGGYLNIKYSSGLAGIEKIMITEEMVSGFETDTRGKQTLTISYEGQTWQYDINMSCRHDFSSKNTSQLYFKSKATCTSAEKYFYSCIYCGAISAESFDNGAPLPHSFIEQVMTSEYFRAEASCDSPMTYYYSCECGERGNEYFTVGTVKAHVYQHEIADAKYLKDAADCENAAVYNKSCACGKAGSDTFTYGNALGHIGGEATCTEAAKCNRCGEHYGNTIPHTFNRTRTTDRYIKRAATCTSLAVYFYSCSCGEIGEETFEAGIMLDHQYTEQVVAAQYLKSEATCTKAATYYYSCYCGAKGGETFNAGSPIQHSYTYEVTSNKYLVSDADCENAAVYFVSCICGKVGNDTFEYGKAIGHMGGVASCTELAVCTRCDQAYGTLAQHVYDLENASLKYLKSPATCTNKAVYYKSCVCGKSSGRTFEYGNALGHTKGDEATCTTAQVCTVCSEILVDALGHTKGNEATCTTAQVCTVCREILVDALGHTKGDEATCTTAQVCTVCSEILVDALGHMYEDDCDSDCAICGEVRAVETDADIDVDAETNAEKETELKSDESDRDHDSESEKKDYNEDKRDEQDENNQVDINITGGCASSLSIGAIGIILIAMVVGICSFKRKEQ